MASAVSANIQLYHDHLGTHLKPNNIPIIIIIIIIINTQNKIHKYFYI